MSLSRMNMRDMTQSDIFMSPELSLCRQWIQNLVILLSVKNVQ